jgi:hypothetical protein
VTWCTIVHMYSVRLYSGEIVLGEISYIVSIASMENVVPKYRDPVLASPLGANLDPSGEVVPQGGILSPGGEILCSPLHSSEQYRVFTPGGERRGEHSP